MKNKGYKKISGALKNLIKKIKFFNDYNGLTSGFSIFSRTSNPFNFDKAIERIKNESSGSN